MKRQIDYRLNHIKSIDNPSKEELKDYVLFSIFDHLGIENSTSSQIVKEYEEILPKLHEYELAKKEYQLKKNNDNLIESTRNMLKEIIDLLQSLYKNCDNQSERDLFDKAFDILKKT